MKKRILAVALATMAGTAWGEVVIGVSVSTTGPGSSLGSHVANAVKLFPTEVAGESIRYVVLDDGSDPTTGARNVRKFATEDDVDIIIGSSTVPVAIAQSSVANEEHIPIITLCPIRVDPATHPYTFTVPQPIPLMVDALLEHMEANEVGRLGFVGFADSWGDLNYNHVAENGPGIDIEVTTNERYARNDTSVNSQVLKVVMDTPDAIFVGASGTPAAMPQIAARQRGYEGTMYHTHGVVNRDFIRIAGESGEGVIAPTGAVVVAEQLSDDNPLKGPGVAFLKAYEGEYGTDSRNAFAAYAWDASLLIQAALPLALQRAEPGTQAFRNALREAIETSGEVAGTHAVYAMTPDDHYGVDERARVLVEVRDGEWRLLD